MSEQRSAAAGDEAVSARSDPRQVIPRLSARACTQASCEKVLAVWESGIQHLPVAALQTRPVTGRRPIAAAGPGHKP